MSHTKKISAFVLGSVLPALMLSGGASFAAAPVDKDTGRTSIDLMADQYLRQYPQAAWLRDSDIRDANNNPIPGFVDPALVPGGSPLGTLYPPTPAKSMGWKTESKLYEGMYMSGLKQLGGFNGQVNSDLKSYAQELQAGDFMARTLQYPPNVANQAKAQAIGQAQAMSNAMGDIAKSQSASAISYCSSFLQNFTVEEGNRWNKIRSGLFVPIAILLLLPGAVLTQVKAMALSSNPVLSDTQSEINPLEGLLRSVVAIFLIPATYLVVNYGIDFSNSIVESIAGTYKNVMGSNMYQDALGSEVRAFPVRTPRENQNAGGPRVWPSTPIRSVKDFENNYITDKVEDPSVGLYKVQKNKTDEAMPAGAVAARQLSYGANAALTAAWNVLCAFQMAYLSYLFFVGPIAAALWVWPMKHFRDALPNWIEGVVTLCFWSLFWNTAILLMACFKGVDESSTMITSALNFLATSSVKFAFDFAGLVKAAGQEAAQKAMEKSGGAKGGGVGRAGGQGTTGRAGFVGAMGGKAGDRAGQGGQDQSLPGAAQVASSPTQVSPALTNTRYPSFTPPGLNQSGSNQPFDLVSLPPMTLSSSQFGSNIIHSQSAPLGNYTISRAVDQKGKSVDLLKTANGHVVAELPEPGVGAQTYAGDGVTLNYNHSAQGTSYSLTDSTGKTDTAHISSLPISSGSAIVAGSLSGDGDATKNSIALKSTQGTMLLENGGNTLLLPRFDGSGYDAFKLDSGAVLGEFALPGGRNLSLSQNSDGSRLVSIGSQNGETESFSIKRTENAGFAIAHTLGGVVDGTSTVSLSGANTIYANYDGNGKLTDVDKISGNRVASTLYAPDKGKPLGYVNSTYQDNGNYQTNYYAANHSLTASSNHLLKTGGGFVDTVSDSNGQTVSIQEMTPVASGGYMLKSSAVESGQLVHARVSNFDASSNLIDSSSESEFAAPATFDRTSGDAIAATKLMSAYLLQAGGVGTNESERLHPVSQLPMQEVRNLSRQSTLGEFFSEAAIEDLALGILPNPVTQSGGVGAEIAKAPAGDQNFLQRASNDALLQQKNFSEVTNEVDSKLQSNLQHGIAAQPMLAQQSLARLQFGSGEPNGITHEVDAKILNQFQQGIGGAQAMLNRESLASGHSDSTRFSAQSNAITQFSPAQMQNLAREGVAEEPLAKQLQQVPAAPVSTAEQSLPTVGTLNQSIMFRTANTNDLARKIASSYSVSGTDAVTESVQSQAPTSLERDAALSESRSVNVPPIPVLSRCQSGDSDPHIQSDSKPQDLSKSALIPEEQETINQLQTINNIVDGLQLSLSKQSSNNQVTQEQMLSKQSSNNQVTQEQMLLKQSSNDQLTSEQTMLGQSSNNTFTQEFSMQKWTSSDQLVQEKSRPGQSLQEQLIDADRRVHKRRTIGEILNSSSTVVNSPSDMSEAFANAQVNYTLLSSLLRKGMVGQAQHLFEVVRRDLQALGAHRDGPMLICSYVELLQRHGLSDLAACVQVIADSASEVEHGYSSLW